MKKKELILILKDIHIMRLYEEELKEEGYKVSKANCGNEALKITSRKKFDLIISDAFLPDIEVVELIREVKKGTLK